MKGVGLPRHRLLVVLLGGILVIAVPTAIALAAATGPPVAPPAPSSSPQFFACVERVGAGDHYCQRLTADFAARVPLTDAQRDAARARLPEIRSAIERTGCDSAPDDDCRQGVRPAGGRVADPLDLELSRRALVAAGFEDVTARRARPDDPAAAAAGIYAVAVGPACVIIEQTGAGTLDAEQIWGRRPDGRCLAP